MERVMQVDLATVQYAGFWSRFFASVLDSLIQAAILVPLLFMLFGPGMYTDPAAGQTAMGYLVNYGFPLLWTILFWKYKSATPGKMLMGIALVDADTGRNPSTGRLVLRYFAYIVSAVPLLLGFIWVAFDKRKQGFHDKIAHTLVIKTGA